MYMYYSICVIVRTCVYTCLNMYVCIYTYLCERVRDEERSRLPRFLFCIRNDDNALMFAIENRYESLVPRTRVLFFSHDTPTTPKECTLYSTVTQS